ncbi:MAG: ferrous iron transport protein A [Oscillospiraceae bacterium]
MQTTVLATATKQGENKAVGGSFPLSLATQGQRYTVSCVRGQDERRKFLANLGFVEGAEVSVVSEMGGNLIIDVKGTRVALNQSLAMRIMIA